MSRSSSRTFGAAALIPVLWLATARAATGQHPDLSVEDSLVSLARGAIDRGRPWQATRVLTPVLRATSQRSPDLALTAARAAKEWQGWSEVVRLLGGSRWLDTVGGGEGHLLLARAHVERSELGPALHHARRAATLVAPSKRAEALVTLARAHDRAEAIDSAARYYRDAAEISPSVAEWLWLRAAGVSRDSAVRADLYLRISDPVARRRIGWTEALARERGGDLLGAAARYEALGAQLAAVRLRLVAGDSTGRQRARRDLVTLLTNGLPTVEVADAIALFDKEFPTRTRLEELTIARRAAAANLPDRAAAGFARAPRRQLTDRDRFNYAIALARLGRHEEAVPLFATVRGPALGGQAAYQRARTMLRSGQVQSAIQALESVSRRFASDSETAATAIFLAGDLIVDRAGDDSAGAVFARAFARFPSTVFGRRAGFQAALIRFLDGEFATAAAAFDSLGAQGPKAPEGSASLYWAGRALERVGDTAAARTRWRSIIARDPDSYYAALASRRGGDRLWEFPPPPDPDSTEPTLPASLRRAAELRALGLRVEAGFELGGFAASDTAPGELVTVAGWLGRAGQYGLSVKLAQRARDRGAAWGRHLAELMHPLPFRDVLTEEARTAGVDHLLVASLIRQESAFDVEARSVADARGLMQVLPSVGRAYARQLGITEFDPVLLYQADLNLDFGIRHLAEALERFGAPEYALAAFNAGTDRVERWLALRGVRDDPEIFVERIPFTETRDYVRRVLRNRAMYQALYLTVTP